MDKFCIEGLGDVYLYDRDNEGKFGLGRLEDDESLYLVNTQDCTAVRIPEEYQKTKIHLIPDCGGYRQGLIMVSLLGEIDLQYHHDLYAAAGMWGWIDTQFNVVIPPQYPYALNIRSGRALVCKGKWSLAPLDPYERTEDGCPRMSEAYYQKLDDKDHRYWCDEEQWGVIDMKGREIVPCRFDELTPLDGDGKYFLAHKGGWEKGNYCLYDAQIQTEVLQLDFYIEIGYMFNECFVTEDGLFVYVSHIPGEGKDYIYAYRLSDQKCLAYQAEYTERTFNGKKRVVVNKDGQDIIVF